MVPAPRTHLGEVFAEALPVIRLRAQRRCKMCWLANQPNIDVYSRIKQDFLLRVLLRRLHQQTHLWVWPGIVHTSTAQGFFNPPAHL